MEVTPKEVKATPSLPEVDHTGLVRMEGQTEVFQCRSCSALGLLGLLLGVTEDDEVRMADETADPFCLPGPVEGVQVDIGR